MRSDFDYKSRPSTSYGGALSQACHDAGGLGPDGTLTRNALEELVMRYSRECLRLESQDSEGKVKGRVIAMFFLFFRTYTERRLREYPSTCRVTKQL